MGNHQVFGSNGKVVGVIEPDGWLVKRNLDPEKHMLKRPPGWCTDAEHLGLPIKGFRIYTVTDEVWEAGLRLFLLFGKRLNRGYGEQVVLPARFWHVRRRAGARQLRLAL